jgi:uncharacterized membrane protein
LDIPLDEREEALKYYNGYFEDAGEDHEQEIIAELGSPKQVADMIKADLVSNATERDNKGYFTETGYKDTIVNKEQLEIIGTAKTNHNSSERSEQAAGASYSQTNQQGSGYSTYNNSQNNSQNNNQNNNQTNSSYNNQNYKPNSNSGLVILVLILAFTVGLPITLPIIGIIIGVFATIFGLIFGFGAAGIALICAGIALFVAGIIQLSAPLIGMAFIGGGLLVFGIGMLLTLACVALCKSVVPALIKGIVNLCRMPFKNRSVMA